MHASGSLYESELVGVFGREAVRFLVAKAECSPPGLRYTEAGGGERGELGWVGGGIVGVQQALYTSFVPPLGLNFCRAVRRDRHRVSLYTFHDIIHKRGDIKFKKHPAEETRADFLYVEFKEKGDTQEQQHTHTHKAP